MLEWLTVNAELIGVIATIFLLLSFVVTGEVRIRYINIISAVAFVTYGLLIGALSLWVSSSLLIIVHIYKLVKYSRRKTYHTIPRTIFNYKNNEIQNK